MYSGRKMILSLTFLSLSSLQTLHAENLSTLSQEMVVIPDPNEDLIRGIETEALYKYPELGTERRYPNFQVQIGREGTLRSLQTFYEGKKLLKRFHGKEYFILDVIGDKPDCFLEDTHVGILVSRSTNDSENSIQLGVYEYQSSDSTSCYFGIVYVLNTDESEG